MSKATHPRARYLRRLIGLLVLIGLQAGLLVMLHAQTVGPGVSHALAIARAARLSDLRYTLSFRLQKDTPDLPGQETLTFIDHGSGDLPIDFRDGTLKEAVLNGVVLPANPFDGHLVLPAATLKKGPNELRIGFIAYSGPAGKAITRYLDRDDGNVYLYTLFVPMDADMAFPCFDQPDLKARFRLTLAVPDGWTAIANGVPSAAGSTGQTVFAETEPISTYLFAFAAGPFQRIAPSGPGEPALYVRKSQLTKAQKEAPAVQAITAKGIAYLTDYFARPFPFPKYDLVLIPGFPFGGMEHAGATFLNEDGVLFRTAPTQSDYFRRDTLVLHETTHQWFGDLVTMRWFDDLWLKEGFAQYMAYKAMAALKPETEPWKHFYEDIKPLAYGIDETEGTTPIFQDIPNLKDAKSAYGAIVYQKAPAVLKQLNFRLGDDTFRDGLRIYLKQHAYANATWPDLIHAFTQAGGKDVQAWADAWILRRGMPEINLTRACRDGRLQDVVLNQKDVLPDGYVWPIDNELVLAYPDGSIRKLRVSWHIASFAVKAADGLPCPVYVFANAEDEAYGRFLLDPKTQASLLGGPVSGLAHSPLQTASPLMRSMLWGSLWDGVRTAHIAPMTYEQYAVAALPIERDESIARIQGGRLATGLHAYLGPRNREILLSQVQSVTAEAMLHAPTAGLRIVSFRTFVSIAETPPALSQLKQILAGTLNIPGMPLRPLDRWNLIGHLVEGNDCDASALYAAEQLHDRSGEAQKYAYAEAAGTPDTASKDRYFEQYLHSRTIQEDWITQSLGPFNSWNQSALTQPYLGRALEALPDIKRSRKIFFLGAWLNAFIGGQHTPEAQAIVHAWLARTDVDPDLRRKVLEVSDSLDRTVLIRARYPE